MEKPVERTSTEERGNQEEGSVRWRHQENKRSQKRNDEDWGIRESSGWSRKKSASSGKYSTETYKDSKRLRKTVCSRDL